MISNTTVLIVDDEMPFAEILRKRLSRRKFDILSAYSGPEALALLEGRKDIEVVILDVKMPGMDGMDTLRRISAERPDIEVIMLTAYAEIETALKAMKLGAFDCLMKPCSVEHLCARVREAMGKKWKRGKNLDGPPLSER